MPKIAKETACAVVSDCSSRQITGGITAKKPMKCVSALSGSLARNFIFFPITVSIISSPLYQVVFNATSCDIGIVSHYVCHFKGFLKFFKKNLRHSMKYYIMKNMNIFEIEVRTHEHI